MISYKKDIPYKYTYASNKPRGCFGRYIVRLLKYVRVYGRKNRKYRLSTIRIHHNAYSHNDLVQHSSCNSRQFRGIDIKKHKGKGISFCFFDTFGGERLLPVWQRVSLHAFWSDPSKPLSVGREVSSLWLFFLSVLLSSATAADAYHCTSVGTSSSR